MTDVSANTVARLLESRSFVELGARQRARALLDEGSFRELLDPFDRVTSPWLPKQGIVTQADDGVVVAKGTLDGQPAVIAAIEGTFPGRQHGRSRRREDRRRAGAGCRRQPQRHPDPRRAPAGNRRRAFAGGQPGLAAIAEIQAAIVELRDYQPVIGVVAGSVGCFGGMSIAAGLCSYLVVTREARVGLNGPQVIEQEAGLDEYDSRDRPFIWSLTGGEQRYASGLVDAYVADDTDAIRAQLHELFALGKPLQPRSRRHAWYLQRLADVDTRTQLDAAAVRALYEGDAQ